MRASSLIGGVLVAAIAVSGCGRTTPVATPTVGPTVAASTPTVGATSGSPAGSATSTPSPSPRSASPTATPKVGGSVQVPKAANPTAKPSKPAKIGEECVALRLTPAAASELTKLPLEVETPPEPRQCGFGGSMGTLEQTTVVIARAQAPTSTSLAETHALHAKTSLSCTAIKNDSFSCEVGAMGQVYGATAWVSAHGTIWNIVVTSVLATTDDDVSKLMVPAANAIVEYIRTL